MYVCRTEKRTQTVGTGGTATHALHEWAVSVANPPGAEEEGLGKEARAGLSLKAVSGHISFPSRLKTRPATDGFYPQLMGCRFPFLFLFTPLT